MMTDGDAAALQARPSGRATRSGPTTKLRYNDTAARATSTTRLSPLLRDRAVAFLYDEQLKLSGTGREFVVARLAIDFRAELYFPGKVDIGTRHKPQRSAEFHLRSARASSRMSFWRRNGGKRRGSDERRDSPLTAVDTGHDRLARERLA